MTMFPLPQELISIGITQKYWDTLTEEEKELAIRQLTPLVPKPSPVPPPPTPAPTPAPMPTPAPKSSKEIWEGLTEEQRQAAIKQMRAEAPPTVSATPAEMWEVEEPKATPIPSPAPTPAPFPPGTWGETLGEYKRPTENPEFWSGGEPDLGTYTGPEEHPVAPQVLHYFQITQAKWESLTDPQRNYLSYVFSTKPRALPPGLAEAEGYWGLDEQGRDIWIPEIQPVPFEMVKLGVSQDYWNSLTAKEKAELEALYKYPVPPEAMALGLSQIDWNAMNASEQALVLEQADALKFDELLRIQAEQERRPPTEAGAAPLDIEVEQARYDALVQAAGALFPSLSLDELVRYVTENPDQFLADIIAGGASRESYLILARMGFTSPEYDSLFGLEVEAPVPEAPPPEVVSEITKMLEERVLSEEELKRRGDYEALESAAAVLFPGMNVEAVIAFAKENPEGFTDAIKEKGPSDEALLFLTRLGMSPEAYQQLFAPLAPLVPLSYDIVEEELGGGLLGAPLTLADLPLDQLFSVLATENLEGLALELERRGDTPEVRAALQAVFPDVLPEGVDDLLAVFAQIPNEANLLRALFPEAIDVNTLLKMALANPEEFEAKLNSLPPSPERAQLRTLLYGAPTDVLEIRDLYLELGVQLAPPALAKAWPEGIPIQIPEGYLSDEEYRELWGKMGNKKWADYIVAHPEDPRLFYADKFTWADALHKANFDWEEMQRTDVLPGISYHTGWYYPSWLGGEEITFGTTGFLKLLIETSPFLLLGTATGASVALKMAIGAGKIPKVLGYAGLVPTTIIEYVLEKPLAVGLKYGIGAPIKAVEKLATKFKGTTPKALKETLEVAFDKELTKWISSGGITQADANAMVNVFLSKHAPKLYETVASNIEKVTIPGRTVEDILMVAARQSVDDLASLLKLAQRDAIIIKAMAEKSPEAIRIVTEFAEKVVKGEVRLDAASLRKYVEEGLGPFMGSTEEVLAKDAAIVRTLGEKGVSIEGIEAMEGAEAVVKLVEKITPERPVIPKEPKVPPGIMATMTIEEKAAFGKMLPKGEGLQIVDMAKAEGLSAADKRAVRTILRLDRSSKSRSEWTTAEIAASERYLEFVDRGILARGVKAEAGIPKPVEGMPPSAPLRTGEAGLLKAYNTELARAKKVYADTLKRTGSTTEAFKVENAIVTEAQRKYGLEAGRGVGIPPEKPPPLIKAIEIPPLAPGVTTLTTQQADDAIKLFSQALKSPESATQRAATLEMRKLELARRASNFQGRVKELIIEGQTPEQAIKLAEKEIMSGTLPEVTSKTLANMTKDMQDALFAKVYQVLKDEPFELMSTAEALTNALRGESIPRIAGAKGGSAYSRLMRVFGDEPAIVAAIDQGKSLEKIIRDLFERQPPVGVSLSQAERDYLSSLPSVPFGQPRLGETPFVGRALADIRTAALKQYEDAELRLGIDLAKGKITKGEYDVGVMLAKEKAYPTIKPPTRPPEPPIDDAIKQMPMFPRPARDSIIKALREIAYLPVDIGNFLRANKASFDFSFWRQQAPLILNHKVDFVQANVTAWKALWSKKAAEASWTRITRDPLYQLYEEAGYDFLRPLSLPKGTAQWRGVEEFGYLTGERIIPRLTEKLPHIKVSQRAFVTGANEHNWRIFTDFYKATLRMNEKIAAGEIKLAPGEAFSVQKEMTDIARMLSDLTGRASLGKAAPLTPALSALIFAPRLTLGRILSPRHLISANPRIRAEAWKDLVTFVGAIGGVEVLGEQLGLWDVGWNPGSADFATIRVGNTRIDPWGGYKQYVVFLDRVITGTGLSSVTGAEFDADPLDAMQHFIRGKASPLASIMADFWTGKTFIGDEVDVTDMKQWLDRVAPFALIDIFEAYMADPGIGIAVALPAFLGAGVQTYTGDWDENFLKLGLPKYSENLQYGQTEPIYDTRDFWSDTASQFKGVDPATLTKKKGYSPVVQAIAEVYNVTLPQLNSLSSDKLISINADPAVGPTFEEYYRMWRDREKIVASGDEEALKAFDADERTRNAKLGDFGKGELDLLRQYWMLMPEDREAFLEEHTELTANKRDDWLRANPKENAQLAIWGKAKILTQEAYDEAMRLAKKLGIPDSALNLGMPPDAEVPTYFEYQKMLGEDISGSSLEIKLLRYDNPEFDKWGRREYGWGKVEIKSIEAARLTVKNRELQAEYDALRGRDLIHEKRLKDAWLADPAHAEFVRDTKRIDGYNEGYAGTEDYPTEAFVEDWADYYTSDFTGKYEDDWFLQEHPDFYRVMTSTTERGEDAWTPRSFKLVPTREVAAKEAIWKAKEGDRKKWDYLNLVEQEDLRAWKFKMKEAEGIKEGLSPENATLYAEFYSKERPGYEDDWFFYDPVTKETNAFYEAMVNAGLKTGKDFSKVPSWEVAAQYKVYQGLKDDPVLQKLMRLDLPGLNNWGILALGWAKLDDNERLLRLQVDLLPLKNERDALITQAARDDWDALHPYYATLLLWQDAMKLEFKPTETYIRAAFENDYIAWKSKERKGYEDDWFLYDPITKQTTNFYKTMVDLGTAKGGLSERDFTKVPTRKVAAWYEDFQKEKNDVKQTQMRLDFPEGNAWLELTGKRTELDVDLQIQAIRLRNVDIQAAYDAAITEAARDKIKADNPDYVKDLQRIEAYKLEYAGTAEYPESSFVEDYADYRIKQGKGLLTGYEDNWFWKEHPKFYDAMVDLDEKTPYQEGWEDKLPTREQVAVYNELKPQFEAKAEDHEKGIYDQSQFYIDNPDFFKAAKKIADPSLKPEDIDKKLADLKAKTPTLAEAKALQKYVATPTDKRLDLRRSDNEVEKAVVKWRGLEPLGDRGLPKTTPMPEQPWLDINKGTKEEWESLPGIGPSLAQKILDYIAAHGAFKSIDDLEKVPGIGKSNLEKIRKYLRL